MGKLNLIQGKWDGKVGQTVGAKWKSKATIRAYAKPSNPNTAMQQEKRGIFSQMSIFLALFTDQIKTLTSLNTRGMTVRNAIIKANKDQYGTSGAFDPATLIVNKGGLVNVRGTWSTVTATGATLTYTAPTATNISDKAKVVAVAVSKDGRSAAVGTGNAKTPETITLSFNAVTDVALYYWLIDYRGSTRVGSISKAEVQTV